MTLAAVCHLYFYKIFLLDSEILKLKILKETTILERVKRKFYFLDFCLFVLLAYIRTLYNVI